MGLVAILFLATIVATCSAESSNCQINPIRLLHSDINVVNCLSWRLAVETNNIRDFQTLPSLCQNYVGGYMQGKQYRYDCEMVVESEIDYAKNLELVGDGRDIWVFDIDETTLSNLPYYSRSDVMFGKYPYNSTLFHAWIEEANAPAVPGSLRLYETLLELGFKIVFLSGHRENVRGAREINLKNVGFHTWEKLILKGESDQHASELEYKSKKRSELVRAGYRILGNTGDQWSDILGPHAGQRTFKVPNPMYYTS